MNAVSVFTLMAAKQAGVPVRIAHSHSTSNPNEKAKTLVKNVLRPFSKVYPTRLAACSEYAARWLFGDQVVDAKQVHIIHNAIDIDRFTFNSQSRAIKRDELGVGDSQLLIGQVGRICFQKNQTFTIKVFSELLKNNPSAVLAIVGDGDDSELRKEIHDLRIERNVKLLGIRDDVADYYSAFDILAFPSTYEGLGMASIEAQAADLPVVCSDEVPKEADLIPSLVRRISLDAGFESWVSTFDVHESDASGRISHAQEMAKRGYAIHLSAAELAHWYEELEGECDAQKD